MKKWVFGLFLLCVGLFADQLSAQQGTVSGKVVSDSGEVLAFVNVYLTGTNLGSATDEDGVFTIENVPVGAQQLVVSTIGFEEQTIAVEVTENSNTVVVVKMKEAANQLNETVVTGTLKVSRLESPVSVEVYSNSFLKQNPTPSSI